MARTDAHRPAEMVPANYIFLASSSPVPFYDEETGRDGVDVEWDGTDEWDALGQPTQSNLPHALPFRCDHCGARHTYQTILAYRPTGEILSVGNTCAAERFGNPDFKNQIASAARRAALKAGRARRRAAALAQMSSEVKAAFDWAESDANAKQVAKDIAAKVEEHGALSEKHVAFLLKLFAGAQEVKAKIEAKLILPCPAGKVTVAGKIKTIKSQPNPYGDGSIMKMLVESGDGWRVWGTFPSTLCGASVGSDVEFCAEVEPKNDDPTFGFFKRPSKAHLLELAKAAA